MEVVHVLSVWLLLDRRHITKVQRGQGAITRVESDRAAKIYINRMSRLCLQHVPQGNQVLISVLEGRVHKLRVRDLVLNVQLWRVLTIVP